MPTEATGALPMWIRVPGGFPALWEVLGNSFLRACLIFGSKRRPGPDVVMGTSCHSMMASQKLTNCCVAAIALVTAAYLSTPHSSTIARLAFGAFCLAIHFFCFLAKA
jgi:hypothetical protein